jgi:hypothetical protein
MQLDVHAPVQARDGIELLVPAPDLGALRVALEAIDDYLRRTTRYQAPSAFTSINMYCLFDVHVASLNSGPNMKENGY